MEKLSSNRRELIKVSKRYWRRRDRKAGWSPAGWLPLFGLVVVFGYGIVRSAPAIEAQTADQVAAVLRENGLQDFSVQADGQEVLIRADGQAAQDVQDSSEALVRSWAGDAVCTTWVAGRRVCPNSVRVEFAEIVPLDAVPESVARFHDFSFHIADANLVLSGEVPSDAARSAIVAAARSISGSVTDELNVTDETPTDGFDWAVDRAWPMLTALQSGQVQWRSGSFSVTGRVPAADEADVRRLFAAAAYPNRLGTLTIEPDSELNLCDERFAAALATSTIQFRTGSAEILSDSQDLIQELAELARACSNHLSIDGHTDNVGSAEANRNLSLARAEAVAAAMTAFGIDSTRLSTRGLGASQPIADNSTAGGRARNRRIEIKSVDNVVAGQEGEAP